MLSLVIAAKARDEERQQALKDISTST